MRQACSIKCNGRLHRRQRHAPAAPGASVQACRRRLAAASQQRSARQLRAWLHCVRRSARPGALRRAAASRQLALLARSSQRSARALRRSLWRPSVCASVSHASPPCRIAPPTVRWRPRTPPSASRVALSSPTCERRHLELSADTRGAHWRADARRARTHHSAPRAGAAVASAAVAAEPAAPSSRLRVAARSVSCAAPSAGALRRADAAVARRTRHSATSSSRSAARAATASCSAPAAALAVESARNTAAKPTCAADNRARASADAKAPSSDRPTARAEQRCKRQRIVACAGSCWHAATHQAA